MFTYRALGREDLEAAGQLLVESYPYRAHEPPYWQRPATREQPRRWGARCLLVGRGAGYDTVHSISGNDALIRINRRFGFRETYCEVRLVRRLK